MSLVRLASQRLDMAFARSRIGANPAFRLATPKATAAAGQALPPVHNSPAGAHVAVSGVSHAYGRAAPPVLKDVTFTVEPGQIVALCGRSGCGKSTLLHILAGLATPTRGAVHIDGARVERPSPRWVMMFQSASLLPWLTVAQNVVLGLKFTGRRRLAAERVPEVLRLVELSGLADRNVQDLSGGQQQRVALARSLAPRPDLLLLDEPFSALDAFTRRSLQRDVRAIARELGLTLILVTHDVPEAVRMADRVILLAADPGRIAGDLAIALDDDERETGGCAFQECHRELMAAYAHIAGHDAPGGDDAVALPV